MKASKCRNWARSLRVELATNRIVSVEALVRWRRTTGDLMSPAEFLPLAEEMGLMEIIGEWVFEELCRQRGLCRNSPSLKHKPDRRFARAGGRIALSPSVYRLRSIPKPGTAHSGGCPSLLSATWIQKEALGETMTTMAFSMPSFAAPPMAIPLAV